MKSWCGYQGDDIMKKCNLDFDKLNTDAVLVTDEYNIRYLSGFRGGEAVLFISPQNNVLITDSRYTEEAENESDFTVCEWNRNNRITDILNEYIKNEGIEKLGYEDKALLCSDYFKYREKLTGIKEWIPLGESLNVLRQIKTDKELEFLRKAEEIGDIAFGKVLEILKPKMTELEVAAELEYQMKKNGAEGLSFDTIAASGINSSMPHAIPSNKKLENGDFLTLDFGCRYNGYCSDMTRTVVIGKASEKQKEIYNIVLKANLEAEKIIRAGLMCREVDKAARDIITKAGYGSCFGHGLGHSVGLFIHESPALNTSDKTILMPNMIETIEPGIYIKGFGGVRIEDMVIVTKDGHENLSHSPKELIEV